jgi:hypothetical protein
MPANPLTTWTDNLLRQAKADPKKATILAVLVVVMIFMWFRLFGGSSAGPAAAAANVIGARSSFGPTGDLPRSGNRAGSTQSFQEWSQAAVAPLSRNLFAINYDFFPQDGTKPQTLRAFHGNGFWDQIAKSMTVRADQKREREVLLENLRLQAAQLKVQSTVMGASPRALINGELVGVGDVVASFRVSKIEPRRIVVEREGIKLELRFN